jgi:hypothetical protein
MWAGIQGAFMISCMALLVVAFFYRLTVDTSNPGRLYSTAEMAALWRLTRAAMDHLERSDPRRSSIANVWARLQASYAQRMLSGAYLPFSDALTAGELSVLAPYIDASISAPTDPSDEATADDTAALRGFKERMKANRLWPE